jgi:hypothetical protein
MFALSPNISVSSRLGSSWKKWPTRGLGAENRVHLACSALVETAAHLFLLSVLSLGQVAQALPMFLTAEKLVNTRVCQ